MKAETQPCAIARMSVDEMVRNLGDAYSRLLCNKAPLVSMPSIMLWSAPGLGKSQGVRQLARYIADRTGKKSAITDVRLLLFNPVDLRGIPVANEQRTLAVWLRPKIFDMDHDEGVLNFLFLDEISAAPPSVQAAAYQITLDRVIGEHALPDNCIVIAAGNRVTDKSVAYHMPLALANRLCHIEIECDMISWRRWAVANAIHEKIIAYLAWRPDRLTTFDATNDSLAFPTPRTWEMASHLLSCVSDDLDTVYPLLCGCIGTGAAVEFRSFCRLYAHMPSMDEIFAGRCRKTPQEPDALYALLSAMTAHARAHKDDMIAIGHSIRYAMSMPPDFTFMLFRDYMALENGYQKKILHIPAFADWLQRNQSLL
ncbi:hypothetical protein FACS1894158_12860 [Betaproteobacteria bacterium]|nr:hypothetical protein FACS1894158_12860 [Betaproteobacteria bacterium]